MNAPELAARLDRLPLSRFHRRVLYGIAFAFFFELADLQAAAAAGGTPAGSTGVITHGA